MKLVLGSKSPGRRHVLESLSLEFEVMSADIDEKAIRDPDPGQQALKLARAKSHAIRSQLREPAILITSDQVVAWHDEIREKPADEAQARAFLVDYQQAAPETVTAVVVVNTETGVEKVGLDRVQVEFSPLPKALVDELIAEGSLMHAAGGFLAQDPLLTPFLTIHGELESVMGMPKTLLHTLLDQV
ncbi:Maf family protein [Candidatus Berkelbacteria bacterium]|nr:Maf family protein [Candidatus Berkelbacteria bacterium]